MSLSTPNPKFLLDENVRAELAKFLKTEGFDVKIVAKATTDKKLASISKSEARILVTNDADFAEYTEDLVFSVVWLRIPQSEVQSLTVSFGKMLKAIKDFSGKLVILKTRNWEELPLATKY